MSRLENTGLMHIGYTECKSDSELREEHPDADIEIKGTASLTKTGAEFHYWESVRRNPIRRFWCNFIHSV